MLTTRWGRRQQVEPKPDVRTVLGPFMALKHNPSLMLKLRAAQRTAYRRIRIYEPHGPVDISRSNGKRGAPGCLRRFYHPADDEQTYAVGLLHRSIDTSGQGTSARLLSDNMVIDPATHQLYTSECSRDKKGRISGIFEVETPFPLGSTTHFDKSERLGCPVPCADSIARHISRLAPDGSIKGHGNRHQIGRTT